MLITQKPTPQLLGISFLNVYFSKVKRIVSILLLTLYIASFSGVMLNLHFCGGKLSLVGLFFKPSEIDCCGEVEMDYCCHDHSTWIKIETAHAHSSQLALAENNVNRVLDNHLLHFSSHNFKEEPTIHNYQKGIPLKIRPPLDVRSQTNVFRI
jgi:hypothetical protein